MSGVKVSQETMDNLAKILGLTEIQTKVYIAAMGIGVSTLGQISQLSGINVLEAAQAVQELETQGYFKRIPSVVTLFVPLEPFLKAHMLEFDPMTLTSISETIRSQVGSTKSQLDSLYENVNEKVANAIDLVAVEISESAAWREELDKLKESIQHATDSMKNGLNAFNESKDEILVQISELQKTLDTHIETSVDATNQMLFEVHSNIANASKNSLANLATQLNNDFENLLNDTQKLIVESIESLNTAFSALKTTRSSSLNFMVEFQKNLGFKFSQFSHDFTKFHKEQLSGIKNIDNKLKVVDDMFESAQGVFELAESSHSKLEAATERLSFLYGDIDGRRLFSGKQETLDAISATQNHISQMELDFARKKEEILDKLNTAKIGYSSDVKGILHPAFSGIMANLDIEFKRLQDEFNSEMKDFLAINHQDFEKLEKDTYSKSESIIQKNKEQCENHITKSRDEFKKNIDENSTIFETSLNEIVETGKALTTVVNMWRDSQKEAFSTAFEATASNIDSFLLGLNALETDISTCNNVQNISESKFQNVTQKQVELTHQLKNITVAKAASSLKEVKELNQTALENLVNTLNQSVSAIIYKMKTTKENLETVYNASRNVEIPGKAPTYALIGESAVIMMMRDMFRRTKNELEAVMLVPELQSLMLASKLPTKTRVTLVGNWDKLPEARIRKILESGTVRMRQLTSEKVNLWLLIRDKEEILIAPATDKQDEELVGVVSTSDSLIRLFTEEMSTIKIRDSKDLVL